MVDDSATMRDMVAFSLKTAGFETVTAGDGQQALDVLQGTSVDLIISDLNMPVIVDLRTRFGLPERAYDRFSVFVIVNVGEKVVGLVVDGVEDVIDLATDAIQPVPELTQSLGGAYVRGLTRRNDRLIALLDIDKIVGADLAALDAWVFPRTGAVMLARPDHHDALHGLLT